MNELAGRKHGHLRRWWRARPESWWWITLVVLIPVVVLTVISAAVLAMTTHPHQAGDEIELAKTALSVGAGTGGVVALILAGRRQWHAEQSGRATKQDATERRITELYTKAVDQLGSEKAPVRLGGLYALERLAQDNPSQRETIVDVICAYLRMPFKVNPVLSGESCSNSDRQTPDESAQEVQGRVAAQTILTKHLRPGARLDCPVTSYWPGLNINLTGAILTKFNLADCQLEQADFTGCIFTGEADFHGVIFSGSAGFDAAHFLDGGIFSAAEFGSSTTFELARFDDRANFSGSVFRSVARFVNAKFAIRADFRGARFLDVAEFSNASFNQGATFVATQFDGDALYETTSFGHSDFSDARFGKDAWFGGCVFGGTADFQGATFSESGFNHDPVGKSGVFPMCWVLPYWPGEQHWPDGWSDIPSPGQPDDETTQQCWNRLLSDSMDAEISRE